MLQRIISNFVGRIRRERVNGREYLVAPMTLIQPNTILPGSQGAGFYPASENRRSAEAWNGMPLLINHPAPVDGRGVSAQHPGVIDKQGVGVARNVRADASGKLQGEAWFDVERTRKVDQRVLDKLQSGEPIELSTGLFLDKEPAPPGARYAWVGRNYRPDHVAILPDQLGACSVADGCGVLANKHKHRCLCKPKGRTMSETHAFVLYNAKWDTEARERLSKEAPEDFAGPHQSFPIRSQEDVDHAARLIGHADDPEAVKGKIIAIAKRKGLSIPDSWKGSGTTANTWSDAARQASAEARRAHAAGKKTALGKRSADAVEATRRAGREGTERAHAEAAAVHAGLESLHRTMAESAERMGRSDQAAIHREAAAGHLGAQRAHEAMAGKMALARNAATGHDQLFEPQRFNADTYQPNAYADEIDAIRPLSRMAAAATQEVLSDRPSDREQAVAQHSAIALLRSNAGEFKRAAMKHHVAASVHQGLAEDALRVGSAYTADGHQQAARQHLAARDACASAAGMTTNASGAVEAAAPPTLFGDGAALAGLASPLLLAKMGKEFPATNANGMAGDPINEPGNGNRNFTGPQGEAGYQREMHSFDTVPVEDDDDDADVQAQRMIDGRTMTPAEFLAWAMEQDDLNVYQQKITGLDQGYDPNMDRYQSQPYGNPSGTLVASARHDGMTMGDGLPIATTPYHRRVDPVVVVNDDATKLFKTSITEQLIAERRAEMCRTYSPAVQNVLGLNEQPILHSHVPMGHAVPVVPAQNCALSHVPLYIGAAAPAAISTSVTSVEVQGMTSNSFAPVMNNLESSASPYLLAALQKAGLR